jgi:hypothetical protein
MPGKNPCLIVLESHKQILVAESEMNRALLGRDCRAVAAEIKALSQDAKRLGTVALSAGMLMTVLSLFHRQQPANAPPRRSWFGNVLRGLREATSVWMAFRKKSQ